MPKTSRPMRSASSISSRRWGMRSTGLSVSPGARSAHGCCEAVYADLHLDDSFMWDPPGLFSAAAESVVNRTNRSTPGILANRGNQAANFERNGRRHAVHCVTLPERFARMLLLLHRALNNDSGEVLLVSDRQNRPKDDHDNRQGKPGWRHESVEEKDVHDHGSKKHERQRNKAVHQEQQSSDDLNAENDHPVVGGEERAYELAGETRWRRHGNEVQKSVQAKDQEDQAQQ